MYEYLLQSINEKSVNVNNPITDLLLDMKDAIIADDYTFKRMQYGIEYLFNMHTENTEYDIIYGVIKMLPHDSNEFKFSVQETSYEGVKIHQLTPIQLLTTLNIYANSVMDINADITLYNVINKIPVTAKNLSFIYGYTTSFNHGIYSFNGMRVGDIQVLNFNDIYPEESVEFHITKTGYDSSIRALFNVTQIVNKETVSISDYNANELINTIKNYVNVMEIINQ